MPEGNSGRLAKKANQLYWQTSKAAGRLADELGISRSKFYALIEPLPLDQACQECSAPLAFGSRSDREAGRGRCAACGATVDVTDAETATAAPPEPAHEPAHVPSVAPEAGGWNAARGSREVWLTAIAGVAIGLLAAALWRRR
jgi:hypothetical protein